MFENGARLAVVVEVERQRAVGGVQVQRIIQRVDVGDAIVENAILNKDGCVQTASFRREGQKGRRYVELRRDGDRTWLESRGDGETSTLPAGCVRLVSSHHGAPAGPVVLVDLENAAFMVLPSAPPAAAGVLQRVELPEVEADNLAPSAWALPSLPPPPPGAVLVVTGVPSAPTTGDPVLPRHAQPEPLIESGMKKIAAFARSHAPVLPPAEAALALAGAVRPKISDERAGGPPSAWMAYLLGGGDEHGAALLVAGLRSLGHPARVVTGVAFFDELRWHTWAEVHDGQQWRAVDVVDGARARAPLAEGFRGPLTSGRVGAGLRASWSVAPLDADGANPPR